MRDVLALIGVLAVLPLTGSAAELFGWDKLTYGVEWRLVRSGTVVIEPSPSQGRLHLESAGLLSALFKVEDDYEVHYDGNYCAVNSTFDAVEGKHRRQRSVIKWTNSARRQTASVIPTHGKEPAR